MTTKNHFELPNPMHMLLACLGIWSVMAMLITVLIWQPWPTGNSKTRRMGKRSRPAVMMHSATPDPGVPATQLP
jgi:hypothetical protein